MTAQPIEHPIAFSLEASARDSTLSALIALERTTLKATSVEQLAFIAVNETHRLVDYYQCLLWRLNPAGKVKIQSISGVSEIDQHSQAALSLKRLVQAIQKNRKDSGLSPITRDDVPSKMRQVWDEWLPAHGLWCPFVRPGSEIDAGLLLTRDAPCTDAELELLVPLVEIYAHVWNSLEAKTKKSYSGLVNVLRRRSSRIALLVLLLGIMALPIKESALAPADIVPDQALVVSAPVKGAIKEFHVRPNESVESGQLLFSLDDTEFKSRYEIAAKSLEVAQADYLRSAQKSFSDAQSKSEAKLLKVRVEQKQLEKQHAQLLLERTRVRAEQKGIAVFADVNDWIGQPVEVGERILMLADPKRAEIQIWLAVEDSVNLQPGAEVQMFLNTDPTSPLSAKIRQTSYQPVRTPEGTLAFRLKAELDASEETPRIGLKGTAKVYGGTVTILYYIVRRPLAALRQMLGV